MTPRPSQPDRPNVIWIMGDQHRAQALSGMGDPNLRTPHIDRLAATGAIFTAAVAGSPLCSPFRGSLLTTRYPHECVPAHDYPMSPALPTIAHAFREAGYDAAYFGKWHVDGACHREKGVREAFQLVAAERRGGFDAWLGYENNNSQWDSWVHGHDAEGREIERYRLPGYETDALSDLLIRYLRDLAGPSGARRPFFAVLSVQPPHAPYKAPAEWMQRHTPEGVRLRPNVPNVPRVVEAARHDLAGYYAMIENLDWNVGRIVKALEECGLAENTYLIFFSDHGDMHGSHGCQWKCMPYEESIRIPFVVGRGAGKRLPLLEGRSDAPINHVDIASTTLGLCGLPRPKWMAGFDWSGRLRPDRRPPGPEPDSAFLQLVDPGWRLGFAPDRERPWRGIVTRDGWKYSVLEGQPWMMYNLLEDPYELVNLALDGRFWTERKRLQDRLAAWIAETHDAFRLPEIFPGKKKK